MKFLTKIVKSISICTLLLTVSSTYAARITKEDFNPNPEKDDVIVSMPGGIVMAFKKVYTSNNTKENLAEYEFIDGKRGDNDTNKFSQSLKATDTKENKRRA